MKKRRKVNQTRAFPSMNLCCSSLNLRYHSFWLTESVEKRCKNDSFQGNDSEGIAGAVQTGQVEKSSSLPKKLR